VVQAEGIVATIEREPLVARDNTISKTRFTGEDARNLPTSSIDEVVELSAGIYVDTFNCGLAQGNGCGFIVRGGRATESATFVDGVLVTDLNSQTNSTNVSNFAVEEVDVLTGGFNAEFGHAQSGIINIVTREGGREYHGNVRFTTDELSDAIEQSYGFNNLQASLGGPIIPDLLTAYGSFEATGAAVARQDLLRRAAVVELVPRGGLQPGHGEPARQQRLDGGDPAGQPRRSHAGARQADRVPAVRLEGYRHLPVLARPVRELSAEPRAEPVQFLDRRADQDARLHSGL
jgi:outer membrane receptor protein involved in Fe transport